MVTRLVANHVDVTPRRDQERIAYVPEGLWLAKVPNVPPDILCKLTRKDTTKYRRLHRDDISPTLRCGEALYHPQENRYITPREAARLQGISDNHVFEGPIVAAPAAYRTWTNTVKWRTRYHHRWPTQWPSNFAARCVFSRGTIRTHRLEILV